MRWYVLARSRPNKSGAKVQKNFDIRKGNAEKHKNIFKFSQKSGKPFSGLPLSDFSEKVLYTILLIPEDISWQGV